MLDKLLKPKVESKYHDLVMILWGYVGTLLLALIIYLTHLRAMLGLGIPN